MESLRDYYKKQYEFESSRRQALSAAVGMPLAVVTLVLGGLIVVAKAVPAPITGSGWLQLFCIAAAFILVLASAYFIAKSIYGFDYGHLPTAAEIKTYYEKLVEHYQTGGKQPLDSAKATAELETLEHLDSETALCASINSKNNDRRSLLLHYANGTLLFSVVALTVASGPYIADSMFVPSTPQKIEITNLKETAMQLQRHSNQSGNDQKPVQEPTPSPAPATEKPSPPPGRLIKEDNDKKVR